MIYEVVQSEQAEYDLRAVYEYIAFDLKSPENANSQLNRLEEMILSLNQFPERFRLYQKEPWLSRNTRIAPKDNYLIFYMTDTEKKL